ncbi:MAG: hypothetical protein ACJAVI_001673 [Candidatus Azotimanducaceae bacterium]
MLGKAVLGISALAFITYGLVSVVSPEVPAGFAGLEMGSGDAFVEITAMYGGLQTGVGFFCLLALLRSEFYRPGLVALVLGIGTLAFARLFGLVMTTEAVTSYTYGALIYEFSTAALAVVALLRK